MPLVLGERDRQAVIDALAGLPTSNARSGGTRRVRAADSEVVAMGALPSTRYVPGRVRTCTDGVVIDGLCGVMGT